MTAAHGGATVRAVTEENVEKPVEKEPANAAAAEPALESRAQAATPTHARRRVMNYSPPATPSGRETRESDFGNRTVNAESTVNGEPLRFRDKPLI